MMRILKSAKFSRVLFLGFSIITILLSAKEAEAQFLKNKQYSVRIFSEYDSSATGGFIANYPTLDLTAPKVSASVGKIADHLSGTLFIVGQVNTKYDDDELLLQLGNIKIYKNKAIVGGRVIGLEELNKDYFIIRITYQQRPGIKPPANHLEYHDDLKLSEVIFYDETLKSSEARIVESYLAMKYSINITKNSQKNMRDYWDVFGNKVWNIKSDSRFDESVFALGRIDEVDFHQAQTRSSDTEDIVISLDTISQLGETPELKISNKSLLIIARKKPGQGQVVRCGTTPQKQVWKLNFVDWRSSATDIYLTLDTVIGASQQFRLIDGNSVTVLDKTISGQKTRITIPLPKEKLLNKSMFLSLKKKVPDCKPLCKINVPQCDTSGQNSTVLEIITRTDSFPLNISVLNLDTYVKLDTTIAKEFSFIENLDPGRYHLIVENDNAVFRDEVFSLSNCQTHVQGNSRKYKLHNGRQELLNSRDSSENLSTSTQKQLELPQIYAYPNPTRAKTRVNFRFDEQLNATTFDIRISDAFGRIIYSGAFTPLPGNRIYRYSFPVKGPYSVRFMSQQSAVIKRIVIH